MQLRYIIDGRKFKNNMSQGIFDIIDNSGEIIFSHDARSGGFGKGSLQPGEYKAVWYTDKSEKAFVNHGLGWLVSIIPQFETDRTQLAIHPDGNVEGSEGCIVMRFQDPETNLGCRNLLRDKIEQGPIPLTVVQI